MTSGGLLDQSSAHDDRASGSCQTRKGAKCLTEGHGCSEVRRRRKQSRRKSAPRVALAHCTLDADLVRLG